MLVLGPACSGPTHGLSGHQPPSRESNTLNTSWHVITKKSHDVLSKCMILCWTTFIAILGRMWPAGHRPDTPVLEDVPKACCSYFSTRTCRCISEENQHAFVLRTAVLSTLSARKGGPPRPIGCAMQEAGLAKMNTMTEGSVKCVHSYFNDERKPSNVLLFMMP